MRVPGYKPNYHNTAANRMVPWSTPNNPVNNCSILFQLSNLKMQAAEMRRQGLRSSSKIFTSIVPATTPSVDLSAITTFNQLRNDALNYSKSWFNVADRPLSTLEHSIFAYCPGLASFLAAPPAGPLEEADCWENANRMGFDWGKPNPDGSITFSGLRGGSWFSTENLFQPTRCGYDPSTIGFRIVKPNQDND